MSEIDEYKDGESMNDDFLGEIQTCRNNAMRFLRENGRTIMQTVVQGARQNNAGTRLGYVEFIKSEMF